MDKKRRESSQGNNSESNSIADESEKPEPRIVVNKPQKEGKVDQQKATGRKHKKMLNASLIASKVPLSAIPLRSRKNKRIEMLEDKVKNIAVYLYQIQGDLSTANFQRLKDDLSEMKSGMEAVQDSQENLYGSTIGRYLSLIKTHLARIDTNPEMPVASLVQILNSIVFQSTSMLTGFVVT
jgi:tetrahydromethanopterin S-methyltransferase subunit G